MWASSEKILIYTVNLLNAKDYHIQMYKKRVWNVIQMAKKFLKTKTYYSEYYNGKHKIAIKSCAPDGLK